MSCSPARFRALVPPRVDRHPWSPGLQKLSKLGFQGDLIPPRPRYTEDYPLTKPEVTKRMHREEAGPRALPTPSRTLTHCQDSDHLRSRRGPVGTTVSCLRSRAGRVAPAREAVGALGPAPGPSPPRPARCPRVAVAASAAVAAAPALGPRPRGRRRLPPPLGRHRPGLRAPRPWPRLPAGSR